VGGRFAAAITPCPALAPIELLQRGNTRVHARALVASLPENIATRELSVVRERLSLDRVLCRVESINSSIGPGNALMIVIETDATVEVFTGFGTKGVTAEQVASGACDEAQAYLAADVPVGMHLADQLLIPMALAGGGTFRTLMPSAHTTTNADVIQRFMDVRIAIDHEAGGAYRITVGHR
jgi:RNA 3'-terminal phosphate cyclase (ATP)